MHRETCAAENCAIDARITAAVRSELAKHSNMGSPANLVWVEQSGDQVLLFGNVSTVVQSEIAERAASNAAGGQPVVNSIHVSHN